VLRAARADPTTLFIGADANGANLRDASRRAGGKSARGGASNALFGRLALEDAPGELAGFADRLTIHLPWGSLLRALALPEPEGLQRLRGLCRRGAPLRVVLGYHPAADPGTGDLPPLDGGRLALCYRGAGFTVRARPLAAAEVRALPTTWAAKLAWSGKDRPFVELAGEAE
jgi:hypothetical protein